MIVWVSYKLAALTARCIDSFLAKKETDITQNNEWPLDPKC